ncbi:hypothetical protein PIB30_038428 [Stylosanthes scabra]|uniref:Uncharacterized protein n=1 Tax=Stylosanthes scabra TaxID=79078 RepID=A0ABU6WDQ1_9FABA|nr:hypothetical protein [Stylosanthes scabra]
MKKFLTKLKSCYCPRPTKKKPPPPKPAPSIAAIHRPLQIHSASTSRRPLKRRGRDWEPALSDISEDSREDRDSIDDNNIVITKPKKKPTVVILSPHSDNYHDREWWKSLPMVVSSFAFSMG